MANKPEKPKKQNLRVEVKPLPKGDLSTRLLFLQPTPYCNINCSYCYLPNRNMRTTMSTETARAALRAIQSADLNKGELSVVWHSGEPLVLGAAYYREVFAALRDEQLPQAPVRFGIQTNAVSVTKDHCELFQEYEVTVGVSLDGPALLHDAHRRTRNNKGTHHLTLRGLELLQRYGLEPGVICVVTKPSLRYGRELVNFFHSLGVKRVALSFEAIVGVNNTSSLQSEELSVLETFLRDVYRASNEKGVSVREFQHLCLFVSEEFTPVQQVTPFSMVAVDWQGNFTTFNAELLDLTHDKYGHFRFGNVHSSSMPGVSRNPKFKAVYKEIREGVAQCQAECSYFAICGGGDPSNKLAELGTFAGTETLHCRIRKKAVAKVFFEERSCSPF